MPSLSTVPTGAWPVAFFVGAAVGSFLNVCIHRLPAEESIVWPRSRCPRCRTLIAWYDNVPLLSWVLLGARCRTCHAPISSRYPLVEAATGTFAVLSLLRFGLGVEALVAFVFAAALLLITFIDLDHLFIPDEVSLPGIVVGMGVSFLPGGIEPLDAYLGALAGGGLLWAVAAGYERTTGREGMGFGDVKLLAMIGAFLGWQTIPLILVVASLGGSVAGAFTVFAPRGRATLRRVVAAHGPLAFFPFLRRRLRRTAIPFGPFLALGALVALYVPGAAGP